MAGAAEPQQEHAIAFVEVHDLDLPAVVRVEVHDPISAGPPRTLDVSLADPRTSAQVDLR